MKKIILASNSPRRRQLLSEAGYQFEAINTDFDETFADNLTPQQVAEHLAQEKNNFYRHQFADEILITSDTIVVMDDTILGKPADYADATKMLKKLSGASHQVISGVCISERDQQFTFHDTTQVFFDLLSEAEIKYYIETCKPYDKAGAYGIQDWIGLTKIRKIEGSYFNVMGLPIRPLYLALKDRFGVTPF
ncbi:MAG: septum formation protein Maf [Cyclobacteriaceae bacterium]|nr:septum formation protein Maf [Cyclobacteriaceae bacterium SS2]